MKFKTLYLLLSLAIIVIFIASGCGKKADKENQSVLNQKEIKNTTIATSFYPIYIFTLNIVKDIPDIKVINMTKPTTGCLHDYAVTPDDMKTLEEVKFFIINGAEMESFMDKVIQQMPDLKTIDSSKGIELIKGRGDMGNNPHIWVSISNTIMQVKNIGDQLSALDPVHAAKYRSNTDAYIRKLEAERNKMHKSLAGLKNRDIITFHEAFPYFAKEFNLNIAGVIEREPGSEPSPKELADTIDLVNKLKVNAIFAESQYPAKSADTIAKETGTKVYTLDPVVTGPMDADAYISIMDSNLKTLQEALK